MAKKGTPTSSPVEVTVGCGTARLEGILTVPEETTGLVLFAHGSSSSRLSPRNQYVARVLNDGGLATLLFDLLAPSEESVDLLLRELRFDIALLAERLVGAIDWVGGNTTTLELPLGLFGSSTGAAAALIAATERPVVVQAVVSRGGRPDLAGGALPRVEAPTLLIVGGRDNGVIVLNERARAEMSCNPRLEIVPDASHLFEEPGTLERAAKVACGWFRSHLGAAAP